MYTGVIGKDVAGNVSRLNAAGVDYLITAKRRRKEIQTISRRRACSELAEMLHSLYVGCCNLNDDHEM